MPTEIYMILIGNVFNSCDAILSLAIALPASMWCVVFVSKLVFKSPDDRPTAPSITSCPSFSFCIKTNQPRASLFFVWQIWNKLLLQHPAPSLHHNLGVIEAIFLCKPCWLVSQELVFGQKIRTCVRRFALSGYRQWHLHVPGMILESIQALKNLSMPI